MELLELARCGDLDGVKRLIQQGVHVNTMNCWNETALYLACENGRSKVAQYLLDHEASVSLGDDKPLIAAVKYKRYDCVRLLLEYHADANCTNIEEESPMYLALKNDDYSMILLLLQYDATSSVSLGEVVPFLLDHAEVEHTKVIQQLIDKNLINVTVESTFLAAFDFAFRRGSVELAEKLLGLSNDSNSQMEQLYSKAVYYSAENNWPNILSKLFEKRVDVDAVTEGQTALCAACREGHESVVRLLLHNGANPNVQDGFGTTALHYAVGHCRFYDTRCVKRTETSIVEMLSSAGADVNALDIVGASPLYLACEKGKTEFVKLLLRRGANPNVRTKGTYPLHAAYRAENYDVIKLLLDYKADVNVPDVSRETVLHYAVESVTAAESMDSDTGNVMVQLLLDAGADVNVASNKGQTPFYIACLKGLESVAKKMLECGAMVDGNSVKKLPLNAACKNKHVSVVLLLLTNGANPNLLVERDESCYPQPSRGSADKSPLVEACLVQNVELVDMLLKYGADPNLACTSCDATSQYTFPLFIAIDKGNRDIITLLLNAGANVNAVNAEGKNVVCFAAENLISKSSYESTEQIRKKLSTIHLLIQNGANFNTQLLDSRTPLMLVVEILELEHGSRRTHCVSELLQLMVKHGAMLRDSCYMPEDDVYCKHVTGILTAFSTFDGRHEFIVELFRAGAGFQLIARCCNAVATISREANSISLCQAAVLAGYVPSARELQKLHLAAARDNTSGHQIQQLVNWLNEDRKQVPSLLRQCRVVIRRQLSVAVHFQSILPAIDKLLLPDIVKLYLQFDGPLTEVDVTVNNELQTSETSDESSLSDDETYEDWMLSDDEISEDSSLSSIYASPQEDSYMYGSPSPYNTESNDDNSLFDFD